MGMTPLKKTLTFFMSKNKWVEELFETSKIKKLNDKFTIFKMKQFNEVLKFFIINKKFFIFRGQSNSKWKINSSWVRENSNNLREESFCRSNIENIFSNCIKRIKSNSKYKNMDSLEILASLQHSKDVPTPLIDFTDDILLGFWFSICENLGNNDASLYILQVDTESIQNKIKNFNSNSNVIVIESPLVSNRAISQRSYFVVDNKNLEKDTNVLKIVIKKNLIKEIQIFLKNNNKSHKSIYPDLKGEYLNALESTSGKYTLEGLKKVIQDKYQEARMNYSNAIDLDSNNDLAYSNRALCNFELKEYHKAFYDIKKAIKINPNSTTNYYNKSIFHIYLKEYRQAIKELDIAIKINPLIWELYFNKSVIYTILQDYEKALKILNKGIKLMVQNKYSNKKNSTFTKNNFILNLNNEKIIKNNKKSNLSNEEIIKKHEESSYFNRSILYVHLKKYSQAIQDLKKVLKINPNNKAAKQNLNYINLHYLH